MVKLTELREECNDRQQVFVQLVLSGVSRGVAYQQAGFVTEKPIQRQQNASRLLTKNDKVKAYYRALRAEKMELALKAGQLTRNSQLIDLERAKRLALENSNASHYVKAVNEQNKIKGFHTELAPNADKDALRKLLKDGEAAIIQEYVQDRMREKAKLVESVDITPKGGNNAV